MLMIFDTEPKFCKRCTHDMTGEEKYLILGNYYCRPCEDTIRHDPEYKSILEIWGIENIET